MRAGSLRLGLRGPLRATGATRGYSRCSPPCRPCRRVRRSRTCRRVRRGASRPRRWPILRPRRGWCSARRRHPKRRVGNIIGKKSIRVIFGGFERRRSVNCAWIRRPRGACGGRSARTASAAGGAGGRGAIGRVARWSARAAPAAACSAGCCAPWFRRRRRVGLLRSTRAGDAPHDRFARCGRAGPRRVIGGAGRWSRRCACGAACAGGADVRWFGRRYGRGRFGGISGADDVIGRRSGCSAVAPFERSAGRTRRSLNGRRSARGTKTAVAGSRGGGRAGAAGGTAAAAGEPARGGPGRGSGHGGRAPPGAARADAAAGLGCCGQPSAAPAPNGRAPGGRGSAGPAPAGRAPADRSWPRADPWPRADRSHRCPRGHRASGARLVTFRRSSRQGNGRARGRRR